MIGFSTAPLPFLAPILATNASMLTSRTADSAAILLDMLLVAAVGYGAMLLFGVPIHLALRRAGQQRLFAYVGLVIVTAFSVSFALAALETVLPPLPWESNPFGMTMWSSFGAALAIGFAAAGSIAAWIFWKIAVSNKPI